MPRLRLDVALTLLVLAVLALAPFIGLGANHYLTMFARMMILAAAAVSLSFLVGGAGLASLGHAAAMGVGAYAVAILDAHRLTDITIVLPVAIAAAALFSLLTGAIAIRTEGVNFIMITLAFGQMAFFTASSLAAYGGDDGYTMYDRTEIFGSRLMENRLFFHYLCLGFLATEFVAPAYMSWQRSGELIFMVILGGLGRLSGAILGAVLFVLLETWLPSLTTHWKMIFGPLLILAVLFMRGGLIGFLGTRRG